MNVFLDTSALVKFFNVEQGTDRVTQLKSKGLSVSLSNLSILAYKSFLC